MTREEAQILFSTPGRLEDKPYYHLIDKIYDDFEGRTCENCKHYDFITFQGRDKTYQCNLQYDKGIFFEVQKDFGCNKWEVNK